MNNLKNFKEFKITINESSNLTSDFDQEFLDVEVHKFTIEELKSNIEEFDDSDEESEWLEDGDNLLNYQTKEIMDKYNLDTIYYVGEDDGSYVFEDMIDTLNFNYIESIYLTNIDGEDTCKVYEYEGGRIMKATIEGGFQSDMIVIYFDETFYNINIMKSLRSINKFKL